MCNHGIPKNMLSFDRDNHLCGALNGTQVNSFEVFKLPYGILCITPSIQVCRQSRQLHEDRLGFELVVFGRSVAPLKDPNLTPDCNSYGLISLLLKEEDFPPIFLFFQYC